jgi:hypothetical protein
MECRRVGQVLGLSWRVDMSWGELNFRVPHSSRFMSSVRFFLPFGTRRVRRKDRPESASGNGRVEDQKTCTLEHNKGAPPQNSKSIKGCATGPGFAVNPISLILPAVVALECQACSVRWHSAVEETSEDALSPGQCSADAHPNHLLGEV